MRMFRYLFILIMLAVGISFAILNPGNMTLNYWVATKTLPLALFIVIIFVSGCLVGLMLAFIIFLRTRLKILTLERRLKLAKKEICNLRVIPAQSRI